MCALTLFECNIKKNQFNTTPALLYPSPAITKPIKMTLYLRVGGYVNKFTLHHAEDAIDTS